MCVYACACEQGALLVARYCLKNNDFRGAIEFFLIARRSEEAYSVAEKNDEVCVCVCGWLSIV